VSFNFISNLYKNVPPKQKKMFFFNPDKNFSVPEELDEQVSTPKPAESRDETEEEEEDSMRLYLEPDTEQPEDEIILSSQKTPGETTVTEKARLVL
jgi:hypothetical protein